MLYYRQLSRSSILANRGVTTDDGKVLIHVSGGAREMTPRFRDYGRRLNSSLEKRGAPGSLIGSGARQARWVTDPVAGAGPRKMAAPGSQVSRSEENWMSYTTSSAARFASVETTT